jgi:hypothetical protein
MKAQAIFRTASFLCIAISCMPEVLPALHDADLGPALNFFDSVA